MCRVLWEVVDVHFINLFKEGAGFFLFQIGKLRRIVGDMAKMARLSGQASQVHLDL